MKRVVHKHDLWGFIKLKHLVKNAEWDDAVGKWTITVEETESGNTFTDTCDVFVNAGGPLK